MIKNNTVYNGKIKLMFDKYPEWSGCGSYLNKIHLNLGFTKLVSRIYVNQYLSDKSLELDTREYRQECIEKINKFTGGKIGNHYFDNGQGGNHCLVGFLAPDGTYVGDVSKGWWYYKNKMIVNKYYPHGTAIVIKDDVHRYIVSAFEDDEDYDFQEEDLFDCDIEGIYGFSHRGGSIFRIGDKIFDAKWRPSDEELNQFEYQAMIKSFDKTNEGLNNENYSIKDKIVESMPFTKRGSETIKDWNDAKLAAKNLSKYLG
jgi:hypothetical protein